MKKAKDIQALRSRLAALFEDKTKKNRAKAKAPDSPVMRDETREAFKGVLTTFLALVGNFSKKDAKPMLPTENFFKDLDCLLRYRPTIFYDKWSVQDDLLDDEILAHAADIEKGNMKALGALRNEWKTGCITDLSPDVQRFYNMLINLRYLNTILAHVAKRYDDFEAARSFLMAASTIQPAINIECPYVDDARIERFIEHMQSGCDALAIRLDYENLMDWETLRRECLEPTITTLFGKGDAS